MDFVDVSQFKVVNMNRFSTLKIKLNGDEFLDLPLSESEDYINNLFKCSFKAPSVYYKVTVELAEPNIDDFEVICDSLSAAVFRLNMDTTAERTDAERQTLLNKLPSNRWVLKKVFAERVHCNATTLLRAANYGWRNRNINLTIDTVDGDFKYELIGAAE